MFRTAITAEIDHRDRAATAGLVNHISDELAAVDAEAVTVDGFTIELVDVSEEEVERAIPYLVQVSRLDDSRWRVFTTRGDEPGGLSRFVYEGADLSVGMLRLGSQLRRWDNA